MALKGTERANALALSPRVMSTALEFAVSKASARQLVVPLFAAGSAVVLKEGIDSTPLLIWVGANIAFTVLWFALKQTVLSKASIASGGPLARLGVFAAFIATSSCAWASVGVFAWIPGNAENNYLILMMLVGDIAMAMFTLSPILVLIVAGAIPAFVLTIVMPMMHGMANGAAISLLSVLYVAVLGCVAVVMRQKALESIRLREERTDLVMKLSSLVSSVEQERDAALNANKSRTDFVIQVAHDLREPLAGILGYAEIIRDEILGPLGQSPYRRLGTDIYDGGRDLLRLVGSLEQVLTIEAGRVQIRPERLNVDLVIARAIRAAKASADAREISIAMHVPGGLGRLWADAQAIESALDHLLGHAIRTCPEHGVVSVSAGISTDGGILVRILSNVTASGKPDARASAQPSQAGPDEKSARQLDMWRPIALGLIELHGGTLAIKGREDGGVLIQIAFPPERTVALTSILCDPAAA